MATTTYATLDALKLSLNIEIADTSEDVALTRNLKTACRRIDRTTGRRFWRDDAANARIFRPVGRLLWDGGGHLLRIDDVATAAGLIVEVGSVAGGWTAVTGYDTTPDNALADDEPITGLLHPIQWPIYQATTRVRVTAVFGWPSVPVDIESAALLQAARIHRRKDSPEGILGSTEWGTVRVSRADPDIADLISHLTVPGFG